MNLIEIIQQEMSTDTEDSEIQSAYMHDIYQRASAESKNAINKFLIALCGFDYDSLLERKEEI